MDCGRCLGIGNLTKCLKCGSLDVENTDEASGCEHDESLGATFDEVECQDCDGRGHIDVDDDDYEARIGTQEMYKRQEGRA